MDEIKVIEHIEADDNSIFLKVDDKVYLITIQERMPVNISTRTFNPQPKPEGKKGRERK
jgi:asparagine N-glycosylation enzyme membrane subunit Stt3